MFDPRDPYERCYWHYDSRRPLSIAQLIKLRSVDAYTAALIWLLLERGTSFIIAGPTDPKPGVGKTTVLNALFQFLPEGTALAYTSGMYEDFSFMQAPDINPANTYVLCNEISDHQPFYMWGRVARRYLLLPGEGYRIATSVHADTIDDVIYMLRQELGLKADALRRLGLIIHIGMIGPESAPLRRWVTTHFLRPYPDPERPGGVTPIPLSVWHESDDSFEHADQDIIDEIAEGAGMTPREFEAALKQRMQCLEEMSQRSNVTMDQMYEAIQNVRHQQGSQLALS
ncbi:hypothetical protein EPA93_41040 [Ktedonosporobacter rubrisoli]|uniref:Bacterial type II secretion system protein E domain-containing protein n=1 Tax=Ktedonosporobacter rubrisoli TaxID=2509675 RepID=A0A4P6K1H5_KTERU|nr:hypothetical protein [Ktedonosporobacter rubrisoli]QBD82027.1 hypothetical protein EPA93_41040 [Ktedonosporobacter rubrisoli]